MVAWSSKDTADEHIKVRLIHGNEQLTDDDCTLAFALPIDSGVTQPCSYIRGYCNQNGPPDLSWLLCALSQVHILGDPGDMNFILNLIKSLVPGMTMMTPLCHFLTNTAGVDFFAGTRMALPMVEVQAGVLVLDAPEAGQIVTCKNSCW